MHGVLRTADWTYVDMGCDDSRVGCELQGGIRAIRPEFLHTHRQEATENQLAKRTHSEYFQEQGSW